MKKLKRILFSVVILLIGFTVYVEIVNRHSKQMTYRQKILKAVYPAWMWWSRTLGKNAKGLSSDRRPSVSFHALSDTLNDGRPFAFEKLKGKKVLLVNTASNCGFTNQYDDLQKLSERYQDRLVILGFPANDFKDQEKGTDEEIAAFCKLNFGVSFPLMKKSTVIKKPGQNRVFQWLTDSSMNGWNNDPPSWNFTKYLVNEEGRLMRYFGPSISPLSDEMIDAIDK